MLLKNNQIVPVVYVYHNTAHSLVRYYGMNLCFEFMFKYFYRDLYFYVFSKIPSGYTVQITSLVICNFTQKHDAPLGFLALEKDLNCWVLYWCSNEARL